MMIHDFAYKSGDSGIFKTGRHKIATTKLKTKVKKEKNRFKKKHFRSIDFLG